MLFFSILHFIFRFIDIRIRFKTSCIFSKSNLNNTIFSFYPRFLLKLFTVHFFRKMNFLTMVALVYVKLTYKYGNVLNFYRFKFRYDKTAAIDSKEFIRIGKHIFTKVIEQTN